LPKLPPEFEDDRLDIGSNEDEDEDEASNIEEGEEEDDEPRYCYCNKPSYGEMVACDGENCERKWFHLRCVELKEAPTTAKWYCDECNAVMKESSNRHPKTSLERALDEERREVLALLEGRAGSARPSSQRRASKVDRSEPPVVPELSTIGSPSPVPPFVAPIVPCLSVDSKAASFLKAETEDLYPCDESLALAFRLQLEKKVKDGDGKTSTK
jgi:hypothetical protein